MTGRAGAAVSLAALAVVGGHGLQAALQRGASAGDAPDQIPRRAARAAS
jgi:hypothetical protein